MAITNSSYHHHHQQLFLTPSPPFVCVCVFSLVYKEEEGKVFMALYICIHIGAVCQRCAMYFLVMSIVKKAAV